MFGPDTPVLAPARSDYRGQHRWVLLPALQFRVVTPVVHEQRLNAFQRAVLGLCAGGLRDTGEIGRLLGLHSRLIELVESDIEQLGYLTGHHAVTDRGQDALRDGFLDPSQTVTTHVYQDQFTGNLWSAAVAGPQWINARWDRPSHALLGLGPTGVPLNRYAMAVPVRPGRHDAPTADEIIAVVSRAERAAKGANPRRHWESSAPERIAGRVSMISAKGLPVYLPFVVLVPKRSGADDRTTTWLAFSPFTGNQSQFARQQIATQCQTHEPLRNLLEKILGRPVTALLADYDRLVAEIRRRKREFVEHRFTARVREHPELAELLTLLEVHFAAASSDQRADERGLTIQYAWQCCETILRRIVRAYPVPLNALPTNENGDFRHQLASAAQQIGLRYGDARQLDVARPDNIAKALERPDAVSRPLLLAAIVFSARHHPEDHPLRRLAAERPHLIVDLSRLGEDRNEIAHAESAIKPLALVESARTLAHQLADAFLAISNGIPSEQERNSVHV